MVHEKAWYFSRTIWGSLVAIFAALASAAGLPIDGQTEADIMQAVLQITGALGALTAIYGRVVATERLN